MQDPERACATKKACSMYAQHPCHTAQKIIKICRVYAS